MTNTAAIDDHITTIRSMIAALPDEAIIALLEPIIRRFTHGLLAEATQKSDQIADQLLASITTQLGRATDHTEPVTAARWLTPVANLSPPRTAPQHAPAAANHPNPSQHTCEICGRTGTRRYIETTTGWRCSPTATKCPANTPEQLPPGTLAPTKTGNPTTAHCTNCARTWTITGHLLAMGINNHQNDTGHTVQTVEKPAAPHTDTHHHTTNH